MFIMESLKEMDTSKYDWHDVDSDVAGSQNLHYGGGFHREKTGHSYLHAQSTARLNRGSRQP